MEAWNQEPLTSEDYLVLRIGQQGIVFPADECVEIVEAARLKHLRGVAYINVSGDAVPAYALDERLNWLTMTGSSREAPTRDISGLFVVLQHTGITWALRCDGIVRVTRGQYRRHALPAEMSHAGDFDEFSGVILGSLTISEFAFAKAGFSPATGATRNWEKLLWLTRSMACIDYLNRRVANDKQQAETGRVGDATIGSLVG